jgi:hypothetical protein
VALGGEQLRKNLPELVWSRSYARFGAVNTIVMLLGGATTLATAIVPPIEGNRRYGGVLFDEAARNALRAPTAQGRYIARDTSDVLLSLSLTYPFFVDALVSAWWFRGNADVARQIALIDAEALAITGTLQGVTNVIAARERPYGRTCGAETPEDSIDCTTTGRYRSFFSGSRRVRVHLGRGSSAPTTSTSGSLGKPRRRHQHVRGELPRSRRRSDTPHRRRQPLRDRRAHRFGRGGPLGLLVPWLHYRGFRPTASVGGFDVQLSPATNGASLTGTF